MKTKKTNEEVMTGINTKTSKENEASTICASTTKNNDRIAEENKKFMSFDIKPVLEMIAGLNLTITETNHSGNLYTIKADDESDRFSTYGFPMRIIVEVCPSSCVALTVMNRKNNRVFINKRGCNINEGEELNALNNLIVVMNILTTFRINVIKSNDEKKNKQHLNN